MHELTPPHTYVGRYPQLTLISMSGRERFWADRRADRPARRCLPDMLRELAAMLERSGIPDARVGNLAGDGHAGYGTLCAYVMDYNGDLPLIQPDDGED